MFDTMLPLAILFIFSLFAESFLVLFVNEKNWKYLYSMWVFLLLVGIVFTPVAYFAGQANGQSFASSGLFLLVIFLVLLVLGIWKLILVCADLMTGLQVISGPFTVMIAGFRFTNYYLLTTLTDGKSCKFETSVMNLKRLFTTEPFQLMDWRTLPAKELEVVYLPKTNIVVKVAEK